jgi:hypothetical protein
MHNNTLEHAAIKAFNAGGTWSDFWAEHGEAIKAAEPWSRERFGQLYRRLMHLVLCGDDSGMVNMADDEPMPWERDDTQSKPDDTHTQARLLTPLYPLPTLQCK